MMEILSSLVGSLVVLLGGLWLLGEWKHIRHQVLLWEHHTQQFGGEVRRRTRQLGYPICVLPIGNHPITITMNSLHANVPAPTTARTPLHISRPFHLGITHGMVHLEALISGGQRFYTHNRPFDAVFTTYTTDIPLIQGFLTASRQALFLRKPKRCGGIRIQCTHEWLEMALTSLLETPEEQAWFVECLASCLEYLMACTRTRIVRFYDHASTEGVPSHVLLNPEVSSWESPLFTLERIEIYAASYTFHQVEQFLTYAVNTLDRAYLKHAVEVDIIGDRADIPSSLYNSFANVCRSVLESEDGASKDARLTREEHMP